MTSKEFLNPILDDELLTRGLGDAEARMLVEWLVERAERLLREHGSELRARDEMQALCRRGRSLGRFVRLWCHDEDHGAACQLAATERFVWPLPPAGRDPCDLMDDILFWESQPPEKGTAASDAEGRAA